MDTQARRDGRTRRAQQLRQAAAFFFEHAGYSYDPKTETAEQGRKRCAVEMARAERDARKRGIDFTWEYDSDGCVGCDCGSDSCACATGEPHRVETCYAIIETESIGECVASLSGICEASGDYKRVIEAELASEALAVLNRR